MKIQIKNRWSSAVQFECEIPDETPSCLQMKLAIKIATERDADLCGANLRGADLCGANLRGADLRGANLRDDLKLVGARPFLSIGPIGSVGRTIFAYITDKGLRIKAGCFFGDRDAFVERVRESHAETIHAKEYLAALHFIDAHVELWSPDEAMLKEEKCQ